MARASKKELITQAVLAELALDTPLEQAIREWWQNPSRTRGFRLNMRGIQMFTQAQIESFTYEVALGANTRVRTWYAFLHDLDRKMTMPYGITSGLTKLLITVYDSKIAIMIDLHGDFLGYIDWLDRPK